MTAVDRHFAAPGSVPDARTGLVVTPAHKAFFQAMPKVELHCHLLGAVRRETFIALAERGNAPIAREEIEAFYTRGEKPVGVLRVLRALDEHLLTRPDDLHRIAYEYLQDAANHTQWRTRASLFCSVNVSSPATPANRVDCHR